MTAAVADAAGASGPAQAGFAVLGVGNLLQRDDGAGVHVIHALADDVPEGVELIDGGTLGFSLLEAVSGYAGLIVVDAARLDLPAGSVQVFRDTEMDAFVRRPGSLSVHEVSISDLLDLARLRDELPPRRALVAIQPGRIDWGPDPGPEVAAAIPEASGAIRALLAEWGG